MYLFRFINGSLANRSAVLVFAVVGVFILSSCSSQSSTDLIGQAAGGQIQCQAGFTDFANGGVTGCPFADPLPCAAGLISAPGYTDAATGCLHSCLQCPGQPLSPPSGTGSGPGIPPTPVCPQCSAICGSPVAPPAITQCSPGKIWQLGRFDFANSGIAASMEFPANDNFSPTFSYTITGQGTDTPVMYGHMADRPMSQIDPNRRLIDSTTELNLHFTLSQALNNGTIVWSRYGSEINSLTIDGNPVRTTRDGQEGVNAVFSDHVTLAAGDHTMTMSFEGGGATNGNYLDAIGLYNCATGVPPPLVQKCTECGQENCPVGPSTCSPVAVCGNGSLDPGEQCDGAGHACTGANTCQNCQCRPPAVCGNGTVEAPEACDDHNTASGDGCSATCTTETNSCTAGTTCPNGTICPQNGICLTSCSQNNQCASNNCVNGSCINPSCTPGSICPNGILCPVNGTCPASCTQNTQCASGQCINGVCVQQSCTAKNEYVFTQMAARVVNGVPVAAGTPCKKTPPIQNYYGTSAESWQLVDYSCIKNTGNTCISDVCLWKRPSTLTPVFGHLVLSLYSTPNPLVAGPLTPADLAEPTQIAQTLGRPAYNVAYSLLLNGPDNNPYSTEGMSTWGVGGPSEDTRFTVERSGQPSCLQSPPAGYTQANGVRKVLPHDAQTTAFCVWSKPGCAVAPHCPNSTLELDKVEECDDGNANNTDLCGNTCQINCTQNNQCASNLCISGSCISPICTPGTTCPNGTICPQNGTCLTTCTQNNQCASNLCVSGSCVISTCTPGTICPNGSICPVNGICPSTVSSSSSSRSSSLSSSHSASFSSASTICTPGTICPNGTICPQNGTCPPSCTQNDQCVFNQCVNGVCVLPDCTPGTTCPNGAICPVSGTCPTTCTDNNQCASGQCVNGSCQSTCTLQECAQGGEAFCQSTGGRHCTQLTSGACFTCTATPTYVCQGNECGFSAAVAYCGSMGRVCTPDLQSPACIQCVPPPLHPAPTCPADGCTLPGAKEYCTSLGQQCVTDSNSPSCITCVNGSEPLICDGSECSRGGDSFCGSGFGQLCKADAKSDICITCVPQTAAPVCGNAIKEAGEECDDGNTENGDTCSSACKRSNGQLCTIPQNCASGVCSAEGLCVPCGTTEATFCGLHQQCVNGMCNNLCGNGRTDTGEQCDSAGRQDGKCTADCKLAVAQQCMEDTECGSNRCALAKCALCTKDTQCASRSCVNGACVSLCGDGKVQAGEACDRGRLNGVSGGCTADCLLDTGTVCKKGSECETGLCQAGACVSCTSSQQCASKLCVNSRCVSFCGDGKLDSGEQCDDGNRLSADGCSRFCEYETASMVAADLLESPLQQRIDRERAVRAATAGHSAAGASGPAAAVVLIGGAAAGFAWMRRRNRL